MLLLLLLLLVHAQVLDIAWVEDSESDERKALGYVLKECESKIFLDKRQAEIIVKGKKVGKEKAKQKFDG